MELRGEIPYFQAVFLAIDNVSVPRVGCFGAASESLMRCSKYQIRAVSCTRRQKPQSVSIPIARRRAASTCLLLEHHSVNR